MRDKLRDCGMGLVAPKASRGASDGSGELPEAPGADHARRPVLLPLTVGLPARRAAAAVIESAPAQPAYARALLVICYNRPQYLRRTLSSVLARLPAYNRPHIYVSQVRHHSATHGTSTNLVLLLLDGAGW